VLLFLELSNSFERDVWLYIAFILFDLKKRIYSAIIHGIFFISQYWFHSLCLLYLHFVFVYPFTCYVQLTFVFFAKSKYHYSSKEKKKIYNTLIPQKERS